MTYIHVARCDWMECEAEVALTPTGCCGRTPDVRCVGVVYDGPEHWKEFDGKDFCSFKCAALYAHKKAVEEAATSQGQLAAHGPW